MTGASESEAREFAAAFRSFLECPETLAAGGGAGIFPPHPPPGGFFSGRIRTYPR